MGVSCSGFYSWSKRGARTRAMKDDLLKAKILNIFNSSKKTYGSPRIKKKLERDGEKVGKNRVARLMREEGLIVKRKKAFRPKTTINNPNDKKSPRVFKGGDRQVSGPNQIWVSDLTYLPTGRSHCYLVTVMDLYNREIKGWDVSNSMEAINTKNAFLEAVRNTSGPLSGLIFHSDQGIQYCSGAIRKKLKFLDITQSMSRKGNCYDNAFAESFFGTMKSEMEFNHFGNLSEARKEVGKYVSWYNKSRLHSSLGYMSPVEYIEENRLAA